MPVHRMPTAWFGAPFALALALDLLTKSAAERLLSPVRLLPVATLSLQYNAGVSFGLLQAEAPFQAAALVALTGVLLCAIVWLGLREGSARSKFAFGLIAGGAAGNLWDRQRDGRVTDFLDVHLAGWHWPTFNVADVAITVGLVVLLGSWRARAS